MPPPPDDLQSSSRLIPLLDGHGFRYRLVQELARVQRSGGFVSLVLIGFAVPSQPLETARDRLARLAERLRGSVRLQDVLALRWSTVAVLMPDCDIGQATKSATRLLRMSQETPAEGATAAPPFSGGAATAFGTVEGGAEALLAAAQEALREAAPGLVAQSRTLQGRPRILIVDDDQDFAQTLAEAVSESGWEGHPCSMAADALQRAGDDGYNALFVDLVMPRASGIDLLRRWLYVRRDRPAVLMSGHDADHEAILGALSLGPVMFMKKPIASADLEAALATFRQLLPGARRPSSQRG